MSIDRAYGFQLEAPGLPLVRTDLTDLEPDSDQVVVEVAGCGICHTDVAFAVDGVPTRHPLPLVLGHEIAGRVVRAGDSAATWRDRSVIVPAVIPCGSCAACRAQRPTICHRQFMPGNHGHGGFATHVRLPARGLCPVPDRLPSPLSLAMLSVIADAVTTPLEAVHRAGLSESDVAVFVGVGGVGGFGVQLAAARGAAVVAIDPDGERLELVGQYGAGLLLNPRLSEPREIRAATRSFIEDMGRDRFALKIFETSGTPAGQELAFGLLEPGGYLAVVGYTPEKIQLRLSNLMAFDAIAQGNWGSSPERYPEALDLVLSGKIELGEFVETFPLDEAPTVFAAVAAHEIRRRAVLIPAA